MTLVSLNDIRLAAERIRDQVVHTPLHKLSLPHARQPLWLKLETFQAIGSFKIRGATNAILSLPDNVPNHGVVAYSSGNHAQAVASAAQQAGISAIIVLPHETPHIKVEAARSYDVEIVQVPLSERESAAAAIVDERNATLIPPFDHRDVIAGQGTIGLEIFSDMSNVDVVLIPISGGGLASGVGTALKSLRPEVKIFGVEPELASDTAESLKAGKRIDWPAHLRKRTCADSLTAQPSELTFAHLQHVVDGVITVSESEIRQAIKILALQGNIIAEPGGAVTTAAYLFHANQLPVGHTVAIVSGASIEPTLLAAILNE